MLTLVIMSLCQVVDPKPADVIVPQPVVTIMHTELDAVGWMLDALLKYEPADRPFLRAVYLPPWADKEWVGAIDFAVNAACNQTAILRRGDRHAGGWLLVYNMKLYAHGDQLIRLLATWDELATRESKFHLPRVNVVDAVTVDPVSKKPVTTKVNKTTAFLAPHLAAAVARHAEKRDDVQRLDVLVTKLTASTGAIYPADFLLEQLLTSLVGKYPEFRQIEFASPDGGKTTPLQALLAKEGFFFEQSRDQRGERGALILVSDVTGKSRVVLTAFGLTSRQPMVQTFDFKDNRTRPDQQFVRNVIEFESFVDASELFVPLKNGLVMYVLTNDKGEIQRSAPPDVVADHTKPDGHTHELEMGMSCVICHSPNDGYNTARNDMELLLGSDVDFFGDDFSYKDRFGKRRALSREEAVSLVAGRFGERIDEPDGILGRARRDFNRAVSQLTEYELSADESPTARLGLKIKQIYHTYRYQRIDAERMCLELGVRVNNVSAKRVLSLLAPAPPSGTREDVMIGLLKNGAEIPRHETDAIYGTLAVRAVETRPNILELLNPIKDE